MANVTDFGQLRFVMRGTWSSSTSYEFNDVVNYNNSVYCYTKATTSAGALPTDAGTWSLMIQGPDLNSLSTAARTQSFLQMGS